MKYKHLLLDADNTLFDFNRCELAAFKLTASDMGIGFSESIYKKYHEINDGLWKDLEKGLTTRDELKVLRYKRLLDSEGITNRDPVCMARTYESHLGEQCFEIDGAYSLLRELHGRVGLYVVTNGITTIQNNRFSRSRLTEFIDGLYISEQMGVSKPSPDFFLKVIANVGDPVKENYLVVGDSLSSDIDGAVNSGLDSCWFDLFNSDPCGRSPTYTVKSFSEIKSIILS